MSGLAAVLAGRHVPGVHRWESALDVADVRHAVEQAGWAFGYVDGVALDARADVLRAIGPNLVVALLMDGPQIVQRWPGRYATVLADDPGSSVLTVNSYGLVRRGNAVRKARKPPEDGNDAVILWKEPGRLACEPPLPTGSTLRPGRIEAIPLKKDHHGILLRLTSRNVGTFSMDGRFDNVATVRLHLQDYYDVALADPPAWL